MKYHIRKIRQWQVSRSQKWKKNIVIVYQNQKRCILKQLKTHLILFKKIGKKLLDPKSELSENDKNTGKSGKKDNIKLNQKNAGDKPKKGCC